MIKREACPQCGSRQYKRNGRIHTGKQNHKCKACGRAFVLVPENHVITEEQRALIERLLLETNLTARDLPCDRSWSPLALMLHGVNALPQLRSICMSSRQRAPKE